MNKNQIDPTIKSLYSCFLNDDYINGDLMYKTMLVYYAINSTCDDTASFLQEYANNPLLKHILGAIDIKTRKINWNKVAPF